MTVTCDFPRPPGGQLICEYGQTAFVEIRNGAIIAVCRTPPSGVSIRFGSDYSTNFKEWVLAAARHERFLNTGQLTVAEARAFADRVVIFRDRYGAQVRVEFRVPAIDQEPEGGGWVMPM